MNYNNTWGDVKMRLYLGGEYERRTTRFVAAISEGSIRRDDNSKFDKSFRTAYFPGAAIAYTVSNEGWFENNIVNYLKLRGSYGITGNDSPFGRYNAPVAAQGQYADVVTSFLTIGSATARWEETEQFDGGFNARFFDSRITLNYSY